MFRYLIALSAVIAATIAGCASAPAGDEAEKDVVQAAGVEDSSADSPGVIEEVLSDADTETKIGCREEIRTGTRVKRKICGPARDDSELIPLISAPPE